MDFKEKLATAIQQNNSLLCVGLDPVADKIPASIPTKDSLFEFLKLIVNSTADLVCAFKPNSAFFEAEGTAGIEQLKKICDYISSRYPNIPVILDAKRGDVDNTNIYYAKYVFDYLGVDAVTVSPFLGGGALEPFLERKSKGIMVLCRTSNLGAGDLQDLTVDGKKLYQVVAEKVKNEWNKNGNCLLVVGATYPKELAEIRAIVGDEIDFLVPGLGTQGGEAEASVKAGINSKKEGMIINSSRGILYASDGTNFAEAARAIAISTRNSINEARS